MSTKRNFTRTFILIVTAFAQLIATQLVTFILSLLVAPFNLDMEKVQQTIPLLFIIILGVSYSIGVFGTGWLAIKIRWLKIEPRLMRRLIGTVAGAFVPLLIALLLYHPLAPGNPFYFLAAFVSIACFYLAGLGK